MTLCVFNLQVKSITAMGLRSAADLNHYIRGADAAFCPRVSDNSCSIISY